MRRGTTAPLSPPDLLTKVPLKTSVYAQKYLPAYVLSLNAPSPHCRRIMAWGTCCSVPIPPSVLWGCFHYYSEISTGGGGGYIRILGWVGLQPPPPPVQKNPDVTNNFTVNSYAGECCQLRYVQQCTSWNRVIDNVRAYGTMDNGTGLVLPFACSALSETPSANEYAYQRKRTQTLLFATCSCLSLYKSICLGLIRSVFMMDGWVHQFFHFGRKIRIILFRKIFQVFRQIPDATLEGSFVCHLLWKAIDPYHQSTTSSATFITSRAITRIPSSLITIRYR